jgi:hypothetical protein
MSDQEKPSVSLQHYIDTRLEGFDKRLKERFEAQEKAVKLAVAQSHWVIATAIATVALLLSLIALFLRK